MKDADLAVLHPSFFPYNTHIFFAPFQLSRAIVFGENNMIMAVNGNTYKQSS